ncbi:hypothetical protein QBC47DRAFT_366931 [Echria macrotheca]|uniref:Uncharacterized protein n=1 Tax=Echria macrotheca TaxID=438768 RepID=A0AAJ0BL84_9PEZI|nr:hypothetical protein QBC47DRAFT_366931 [Echria macrotheca]
MPITIPPIMSAFGGKSFNPATDIPAQTGRVILVTGGNSGLGKQSVLQLARHNPACIWLCARGEARAQAAIDDIRAAVLDSTTTIKPLDLDLTSFASIKAAARRVLAESDRLDILMLNAGIMATPPGLTAEGYEIQFGTNHVGHALLTKLLLPLVLKTASEHKDVRIVVLSSAAFQLSPRQGIMFDTLKTKQEDTHTALRYGQSKLANILFAAEMARRYPQITTVSVHPGTVSTNLANAFGNSSVLLKPLLWFYFNIVATSAENGARNQLWAATAEGVKSGLYYTPVGNDRGMVGMAKDEELAGKLWEWTEKELEGQTV